MDTNNTVGTEYSELSLEQMKLDLEAQRTRGKGYLPAEASKQVFAGLEEEKARIRGIVKEARENGRPSPFLMPFEIETVPLHDIGGSFKRRRPNSRYFDVPEDIAEDIAYCEKEDGDVGYDLIKANVIYRLAQFLRIDNHRFPFEENNRVADLALRRLRDPGAAFRRALSSAKALCRWLVPHFGVEASRRALGAVSNARRELSVFEYGRRIGAKEERDKAGSAEQKKRLKLERDAERTEEAALAAARENRPIKGVDVKFVPDPDESRDLVRVGAGPLMEVRRAAPPRARRAHPSIAEYLANKRQLPQAERDLIVKVWDELERLKEGAASAGCVHGVDFSREPVDETARQIIPISDRRRAMKQRLEQLISVLYPEDRDMVYWLLDQERGTLLRGFAKAKGLKCGDRQIADLGILLLKGLLAMAVKLGYMQNPQGIHRAKRDC